MAQALYEHQEGAQVPEGAIVGTEGVLGDDTLETNWDLADGDLPPPGFWRGTRRRDGCRIPGLAEEEYLKGESLAMERNGWKWRRSRCQKRRSTDGRPNC